MGSRHNRILPPPPPCARQCCAGKADSRRPPRSYPRDGLCEMPEQSGGKIIRQAAGHLRVADEMRRRVDAALAADTVAARTKAWGSCKMSDRKATKETSGAQFAYPCRSETFFLEEAARLRNGSRTYERLRTPSKSERVSYISNA
jgi:hypothetical protein